MAYIEYIKVTDAIYLTHTEVPRELEGKGIGSEIILLSLKEIDRQNKKLIPLCPFVAHYLAQNPEWKKLLQEGFNV